MINAYILVKKIPINILAGYRLSSNLNLFQLRSDKKL